MNSKQKIVSILTLTVAVITATLLHAQPSDEHEQNGLPGTWISVESGGAQLASFMSDSRMIGSIPINIATHNGPGGGNELAAPNQGEWIRTGNREFASTAFSILSSPDPAAGITH